MVFRRKISDISRDIGEGVADFSDHVGDAVRSFACDLWSKYPDRYTKGESIGASFAQGYMSSICDQQPPSPILPPGCEPLVYVFGTYYSKNLSAGGCNITQWWTTNAGIPESDYISDEPIVDNGTWAIATKSGFVTLRAINENTYNSEGIAGGTAPIGFRERNAPCLNSSGGGHGDTFVPTSTKLVQSSAPNCQAANVYPETTINNNDLSTTTTITYGDNVSNVDISVEVDNSGEFSFPTTFNAGDLSITLDGGGLSFGGGDTNGDGSEDSGGGSTTTTILPDQDSDKFTTTRFPAEGDEEQELEELEVEDEEVDWVLVEITTPPRSGKTILQKDPDNNDYFAGYFSWVVTDGNAYWLQQQPIRKQYTAFQAPEAVSGYRMYAVNGAKLAARQYTQIIEGEE